MSSISSEVEPWRAGQHRMTPEQLRPGMRMAMHRGSVVRFRTALALGLGCLAWGSPSLAQKAEPQAATPPAQETIRPIAAEIAPRAVQSLLVGLAQAGDRLVTVGTRGHILYSDDTGQSWIQAPTPVDVLLTAVAFADTTHGWAVGHDQAILHTADGGMSWTLQHFQPGKNPLLDVLFLDAQQGFAVGAYGQFLQTADGGKHWSAAANALVEEGLHFNALARLGDGVLLLIGEQGMLARSGDRGETWQRLRSPYGSSLFAVAPQGLKGAVVGGLRGNAYRTDDVSSGNWTKIATDSVQSIFGITSQGDGSFLLAGLNASLLRLDPTGAVRKVELDRVAAGIAALPPQGPPYVAVESETSNLEVGAFSDVIVAAGVVVTVGDAGVRRWKTALR